MAVLSLPLTFQNSFWSQDYRTGLQVLFRELEKGTTENDEILAFIKARVHAEGVLATSLTSPPTGTAFKDDEGASLAVAFLGLKEESIAQGRLHEMLATELRTMVAEPFETWAKAYRERLLASKANLVDGWMRSYEIAQAEVMKLKNDYLNKTRRADEAEDDARFAPITQPVGDKFTTSPNLGPKDRRTPVRQPTVSERISARLKELRTATSAATHAETKPEVQFDADVEEKGTPKLDKGKGRAIEDMGSPARMVSPPPLSPPLPPARLNTISLLPPIIVAGLPFAPADLSALLARAKAELPLRAVRFPLLGEYPEAFSGEEFVMWLKTSVKAFEGNLDRAEDMARDLTERHNLLRRLGELGNEWESADDAFYNFRSKAFELAASKSKEEHAARLASPLAENVAKRTAGLAQLVSKALSVNSTNEPAYIKARRDADVADQEYRVAVRRLDRQRLGLEERIEETLKVLQKWEIDRLRAVKTVLGQYQTALGKVTGALPTIDERSATLIASYHPEADIKVLMERYRTGPFRPDPQVYESVAHDESDVVFGIDLRKWADSGTWGMNGGPEEKKDLIPPVLTALLAALTEVYPKLPDDTERRKTWIYDVPLPAVHHLRETLNAVQPEQPFPDDTLHKYDAPVLASAVKLWLLELDPPLCLYEHWDDFRKLYPSVGSGANTDGKPSEEQHILDVQSELLKLPKIHLLVLDTIVKHLKGLAESTHDAEDTDEVWDTKLALTMGRGVLRPKQESPITLQDRHPTLLFMDLMKKYEKILPPAILKKKRESDRKVPVRRRTRPVDMRMSRSRISAGMDLKEMQAKQLAQRTGKPGTPPPALPALPVSEVAPVAISILSDEPKEISYEPEELPPVAEQSPEVITVLQADSLPSIPASDLIVAGPTATAESPVTPETPVPASEPEQVPAPEPASVSTPTLQTYQNIPPPPPLNDIAPPSFKSPPPEFDDLPPRPNFKEPPPEMETPPSFIDPPAEVVPEPVLSSPAPSRHVPSLSRSGPTRYPSPPSQGSTSPKPTLSRSPSVDQSRGVLRGPRTARSPRDSVRGGLVSSMASNFNKGSPTVTRPGSPGQGGATGLSRRPLSINNNHVKRSSAHRISEFSARTMASDAEDEVVEK